MGWINMSGESRVWEKYVDGEDGNVKKFCR